MVHASQFFGTHVWAGFVCLLAVSCGGGEDSAAGDAVPAPVLATESAEATESVQTSALPTPGDPETSPASQMYQDALVLFGESKLAEGIETLDAAIAVDPTVPVFYAQLGAALTEAGDLDGAMQAYRLGLSHPAVERDANLWYRTGHLYARARKFDKSVAALTNAHRLDPSDTTTLVTLGVSQLGLGARPTRNLVFDSAQVEGALEHFRSALAIEPELIPALRNVGLAETLLGRFEDGEASFRNVLKMAPGDLSARMSLVRNLRARGMRGAAETELDAIPVKPSTVAFIANTKASIHVEDNNWAGVLDVLQPFLDANPGDVDALIEFQTACIFLRDADSAREALDNFVKTHKSYLHEGSLSARNSAARLYDRALSIEHGGDKDLALAMYHDALEIFPMLAVPYTRFGQMALEADKKRRALALFEIAYALDPNDMTNNRLREDITLWLELDKDK